MLIGSTKVGEILDLTPRSIQRYVKEGKLKPARYTRGGHARFDVEYILEEAKKVIWEDDVETPRGSRGRRTASRTRTGTTPKPVEPSVSVSKLATLTKHAKRSPTSSLEDRPLTLEDLLS